MYILWTVGGTYISCPWHRQCRQNISFRVAHASSLPTGGAGLLTKGGGTASASASARARVARFGSSSAHCDELPLRKLERSDRFTIARARREARQIVADAAAEDDLAP